MKGEMRTEPVKLVCFDLGGVIVRICRSWTEGCRSAGLDTRYESQTPREWPSRKRELVLAYQTGQVTCREYFTGLSNLTDGLYLPHEVEKIHNAWILDEYAGLSDVIDALHERAIETAALSNTNASHWKQLVACEAVKRLRHHLTSHKLGLHKPDPEIYRAAEKCLNHRGSEILFFDDTEENIIAARTFGWRAEQVDPEIETSPQIHAALAKHGISLNQA